MSVVIYLVPDSIITSSLLLETTEYMEEFIGKVTGKKFTTTSIWKIIIIKRLGHVKEVPFEYIEVLLCNVNEGRPF